MKNLFACLCLLLGLSALAQKEMSDRKPFFYKDCTIETAEYKMYIVDAVAQGSFSKFKMKVFNKTNDYLVFRPSEMTFSSGTITIQGDEKDLVVAPNDEASRVINFGGSGLQLQNYSIEVKGVYKVPAGSGSIETPDFELPPAKTEFETGHFKLQLIDHKKSTGKTMARFICTYNGPGIGIMEPASCVLIMPNKQENPNKKRYSPLLFEKDKSLEVVLHFEEMKEGGDMQKSAVLIRWKTCFKESKMSPLKGTRFDMVINPDGK